MDGLLGRPKVEGPELVQETFRATKPPDDLPTAWSKFLRDGFAAHVPLRDRPVSFNGGAAASLAQQLWATTPAPTSDSPEIVFVRSYAMDDGRYANNGWMQEWPDPITKLTWDNAVLVSRKTARDLGVQNGDLVEISLNGRSVIGPIWTQPGMADYSLGLALGYGRERAGRVGTGVGFNAYKIFSGKYIETGATIRKTGATPMLATTQIH